MLKSFTLKHPGISISYVKINFDPCYLNKYPDIMTFGAKKGKIVY
jgi:hypothetical protein